MTLTGGPEINERVTPIGMMGKFFDALNVDNYSSGNKEWKLFKQPYRSPNEFGYQGYEKSLYLTLTNENKVYTVWSHDVEDGKETCYTVLKLLWKSSYRSVICLKHLHVWTYMYFPPFSNPSLAWCDIQLHPFWCYIFHKWKD